jgi:C1A family cysteine protease
MIAVLEAVNYTAHSYNSTTLLNFKHYLSNNIPIIIGMHTGKLFWNLRGPMSTQMYKPINDMDNRLAQGHALTLIGYDDNLNGGSWIAANSLGYHWGDHGLAAIPYACNDEIGEAYVITNFAGFDAGKENI